MGLELAKAFVVVRAQTNTLLSDLRGARGPITQQVNKLGAHISGAFAAALGGGGLLGFVSLASSSVEEAMRAADSTSRLAAVLRATGGAAGFTAEQLQDYASQLQKATTFGDDEIMESMAVLGTFKRVSGDVFKRATRAAADLSATGFGSMESAAIQVGKALEDPVRGTAALRRVGVSFSKQQEEQIKNFVAAGNHLQAQLILLEGIEGQVKGVSVAVAGTPVGRYRQLGNLLGDMKELLGAEVLPLFIKWRELQIDMVVTTTHLMRGLSAISQDAPVFSSNVVGLSAAIGGLAAGFASARLAALTFGLSLNATLLAVPALVVGILGLAGALAGLGVNLKDVGKESASLLETFIRMVAEKERVKSFLELVAVGGMYDIINAGPGGDMARLSGPGVHPNSIMGRLAKRRGVLAQRLGDLLNPLISGGGPVTEAERARFANTAAATSQFGNSGGGLLSSGRFGIPELGRAVQDALLKGDVQEEIRDLLADNKKQNEQMLGALANLGSSRPAGVLS